MTIYDVQNAQKTPIWKQRIIECRSSGMSVKEWCKENMGWISQPITAGKGKS